MQKKSCLVVLIVAIFPFIFAGCSSKELPIEKQKELISTWNVEYGRSVDSLSLFSNLINITVQEIATGKKNSIEGYQQFQKVAEKYDAFQYNLYKNDKLQIPDGLSDEQKKLLNNAKSTLQLSAIYLRDSAKGFAEYIDTRKPSDASNAMGNLQSAMENLQQSKDFYQQIKQNSNN